MTTAITFSRQNDVGSRVSTTQYWENLVLLVVHIWESKALYQEPKKTADILRLHHWFPREMTSEKRVQKFHTGSKWVRFKVWLWHTRSKMPKRQNVRIYLGTRYLRDKILSESLLKNVFAIRVYENRVNKKVTSFKIYCSLISFCRSLLGFCTEIFRTSSRPVSCSVTK